MKANISAVPARGMGPARRRELIGLGILLLGAAMLYFTALGADGWGNVYYAAAAQAGASSWHAMLYGASDAPASITVDKPPASLWLMSASVRVFGLSPTAVALPEAALGVLTVWLVYATVRRVAAANIALLAGAAAALTPIAALVFRYNNPDALLTALLALAVYATVRGLERPQLRWMILVGAAFGFAFLTKQLQAFLPLPGLAFAYLFAAPVGFWARVRHLLTAAIALVITAGWWVALVELTPASARPYIGGSTTNSFLELTVGYNGLGRILGGSGNSTETVGGLLRLFTGATADGISWLLPTALILGVAALVFSRSRPRTYVARALLIGTLGGLVVSDLALSMMSGIYHSYYSSVMLPSLAVAIGIGACEVWKHRKSVAGRIVLVATVAATTAWAAVLLAGGPEQTVLLLPVVIVLGLAACLLIALPVTTASRTGRHSFGQNLAEAAAPATVTTLGRVFAALAITAALIGPAAVSVVTASLPHHGAGPVAGYPSDPISSGDPAVVCLLQGAGSSEWAGAVSGSTPAATYQLSSGMPVMPVGGYTHTDPTPTLDQFRTLVAEGRIHWYIGTRGPIADWVAAHYQPLNAGSAIVYDLTSTPDVPQLPGQLGSSCGVTIGQ